MALNILIQNALIQYVAQSYTLLTEDSEGVLPPLRLPVVFPEALAGAELEAAAIAVAQAQYAQLVEEA